MRSSYVSAVSLVLFMFRLHRLFMAETQKAAPSATAANASEDLSVSDLLQLRASRPASVTGVSHRFRT